MPAFEIVSEEKVYGRYLTVFDRKVRFNSQKNPLEPPHDLHYDVVGHPSANFRFAVVFPFHTGKNGEDPKVTLIREYCQGPNSLAYCLPTGGYDPRKHTDIAQCALAELSEEALLHGGQLVRLIPEEHPGFAEVKWCANRFVPFLVIDPEDDPNPGTRDAEEYISVMQVGLPELKRLMHSGDMMLPSITTAHMALEHLGAWGSYTKEGEVSSRGAPPQGMSEVK
eukprot:CAMPEP_0202910586 /NCGR_PEP_ID=MMETSP1392-20130828/52388_1 /ASSEMBLY_ACC=CAM_ASM_000868 /TAXON_ID=225041 /ORGANISM="Chlamydomonas chlamydogama, Strain SAG 11-48b" /LENGTH=223 /DNA_ID=CAMNT_0049600735 /DNA_START=167 /DNA_END=839 /DNA_ORIENTATION=+